MVNQSAQNRIAGTIVVVLPIFIVLAALLFRSAESNSSEAPGVGPQNRPEERESHRHERNTPAFDVLPLSGYVTDENERPLRNVQLILFAGDADGAPLEKVRSLANGTFSFQLELVAGQKIVAVAHGFLRSDYSVSDPENVHISLLPSAFLGTVSGDVADSQGMPVTRFTIQPMFRIGNDESSRVRFGQASAFNRSAGDFELSLPIPHESTGTYLEVKADGFVTSRVIVKKAGANGFRSNVRVVLAVDSSMEIAGHVYDRNRNAIPDALVTPYDSMGRKGRSVRTDPSGYFDVAHTGLDTIGEIVVNHSDYSPVRESQNIMPDQASLLNLEIYMNRGCTLWGYVRDALGIPIKNGMVKVWWKKEKGLPVPSWSKTVKVREDGTFLLENTPEGSVVIGFSPSTDTSHRKALDLVAEIRIPNGGMHQHDLLAPGNFQLRLRPRILDRSRASVELTLQSGFSGKSVSSAFLKQNEEVSFQGLRGGNYVLRIRIADYRVLERRVTLTNQDVNLGTLDFTFEDFLVVAR